jgi:hypothetical protein
MHKLKESKAASMLSRGQVVTRMHFRNAVSWKWLPDVISASPHGNVYTENINVAEQQLMSLGFHTRATESTCRASGRLPTHTSHDELVTACMVALIPYCNWQLPILRVVLHQPHEGH